MTGMKGKAGIRRWIGPLVLCTLAGLAAHIFTVKAAPGFIMGRAIQAMEERGVPLHAFSLAPRTTPQSQTVVRPSPDLAYLVCRYDFSVIDGPLRVRMAAWTGYSSVSFFSADTNNFLTVRGDGKSRDIVLAGPGEAMDGQSESPSEKGLILIRRLAPTQSDYDEVAKLAPGDLCSTASFPPSSSSLEPST